MKAPLVLRADDGVSWWRSADRLASQVESPDIEEGIYTLWDAEGQVLSLVPAAPAKRRSFLGRLFISVSSGLISETGQYEPEVLRAVIAFHVKDVWGYKDELPADLEATVHLLCRLQQGCQ